MKHLTGEIRPTRHSFNLIQSDKHPSGTRTFESDSVKLYLILPVLNVTYQQDPSRLSCSRRQTGGIRMGTIKHCQAVNKVIFLETTPRKFTDVMDTDR